MTTHATPGANVHSDNPVFCPLAMLADAAAEHLPAWQAGALAGMVLDCGGARLSELLIEDDETSEGLAEAIYSPHNSANWLWCDAFDLAVDHIGVPEEVAALAASSIVNTAGWLYHQCWAEGRCNIVTGATTPLDNLASGEQQQQIERLEFKVYTAEGECIAACKYSFDAAAIIGIYGEGATIRMGDNRRNTLYVSSGGSESIDTIAELLQMAMSDRGVPMAGYR